MTAANLGNRIAETDKLKHSHLGANVKIKYCGNK